MKVTGTHHTGFVVSDMDKAIRFYRDVLGMDEARDPVVREATGPAISRIVGYADAKLRAAKLRTENDEHLLELVEYVNPPAGGPVSPTRRNDVGASHFGLVVDDIAGLHAKLVENGVRIAEVPSSGSSDDDLPEQKAYYVEDPDGNWVELVELPKDDS